MTAAGHGAMPSASVPCAHALNANAGTLFQSNKLSRDSKNSDERKQRACSSDVLATQIEG